MVILLMFIDFSKAFDTVKHSVLISTLEHYGVRGPVLTLLTSYISGRKQFVECNGEFSDVLPVSIGVPQGSVLGPLLFIMYINDIVNCTHNLVSEDCPDLSSFILFADDTNVFVSGPTLKDSILIAERTLTQLCDYLYCNYLHINVKKLSILFSVIRM